MAGSDCGAELGLFQVEGRPVERPRWIDKARASAGLRRRGGPRKILLVRAPDRGGSPRRSPPTDPDEGAVGSALVADLGVGPEVWLFLTLLACVTIFFKFGRFWSIRNLDLLLLFALAPGMMMLVASGAGAPPWIAYCWLFLGSLLWLARCLLDLGLSRRPLMEPNLNAAGLACISMGVLGLFVVETVSLTLAEGSARNPADAKPSKRETEPRWPPPPAALVAMVVQERLLPSELKQDPEQGPGPAPGVRGPDRAGGRPLRRRLATLRAADRRAVRGDLLPAPALRAVRARRQRPAHPGGPDRDGDCLLPDPVGLRPPDRRVGGLDAREHRPDPALDRLLPETGLARILAALAGGLGGCMRCRQASSDARPGRMARSALGARTMAEAGLWPIVDAPPGSFWAGVDAGYRLPVWIAYLALVVWTSFWPAEKNLGTS